MELEFSTYHTASFSSRELAWHKLLMGESMQTFKIVNNFIKS